MKQELAPRGVGIPGLQAGEDVKKLSDGERMSAIWRKLEQHLNNRLAILRAKNDGNLSQDETCRIRGQIAEVKSFLEIGTPKLVIDE